MRSASRLVSYILIAATAACTSPTTGTTGQAVSSTADTDATTVTAPTDQTFDADGVAVTFHSTVSCPDAEVLCTGSVNIGLVAPDGLALHVAEDSDYAVTAADVNGVPVMGTTLDEVRLNAAALGLPIDNLVETAGAYFANMGGGEKTLKEKIKCVMMALGLGGKLTVATFACSACFATALGAELGPPDWLAGILTCGTCARMTGKSIMDLFKLIKECNKPAAVVVAADFTTDLSSGPSIDPIGVIDLPGEEEGGSESITTDDDAPGDGVRAGEVLYHAYWEGHGFTTVVADAYYWKYYQRTVDACAAAGGELKNVRVETHGIGWYKNEGWGDCVKK